MKITWIKRQVIVDRLLDRLLEVGTLTQEEKDLLIDLTKCP